MQLTKSVDSDDMLFAKIITGAEIQCNLSKHIMENDSNMPNVCDFRTKIWLKS